MSTEGASSRDTLGNIMNRQLGKVELANPHVKMFEHRSV